MTAQYTEINIDGMIGPTHHYGGLGVGNLASLSSQNKVSSPKKAAMEGLSKMEVLVGLGIEQYYLPPLERPNWRWLESVGFSGDRRDVLRRCFDQAPGLLSAAYSSAFMWTANAATLAPSSDTIDGKLHVVPANLCSNLHRGQEAADRRDQLRAMFSQLSNVHVHEPLPSVYALRDEGAANHMRLCSLDGQKAIHMFVYGASNDAQPKKFIARQTEQAARMVAGCLKLRDEDCVFVQQAARAIDAGVFHNDVIAMSNGNTMFYHEHAFESSEDVIQEMRKRFSAKGYAPTRFVCVFEGEVALDESVRTYLFNSQLLSSGSDNIGDMELISPLQCRDSPAVAKLIQLWIDDATNPIRRVRYLALDQSMGNGGGPACLRLRAMLSCEQISMLGLRFKATDARILRLRSEVSKHYSDSIVLSDLARLDFAEHSLAATKAIAALS